MAESLIQVVVRRSPYFTSYLYEKGQGLSVKENPDLIVT